MSLETDTETGSRAPGLMVWLFVGSAVGLCHAVAEGTLLGWYGLDHRVADIVVLSLSYMALGLIYGALLQLILRIFGNRAGGRIAERPARLHIWILGFLYAALATLRIVASAPVGLALSLLIASWIGCLLFIWLALRNEGDLRSFVLFPLALAFSCVGATLLAREWSELTQPGHRLGLASGLIAPLILLAGSMSAGRKKEGQGRVSMARVAFGTMIVVALHVLLSSVLWPSKMQWSVARPNESRQPVNAEHPSILLVVLDTVRAGNLELFGHDRETMPFLTKFAREECDLAQPILANAAETLPSHASMFTGHFVYSHGAHKPFLDERDVSPVYLHPLDDRHATLAGWLAELGYSSAAISANIGQVAGYGLSRGFHHFDCVESDSAIAQQIVWLFSMRIGDRSLGRTLLYRLPTRIANPTLLFSEERPGYRRAKRIKDLALRWLRGRDEEPFFLFLNFLDAHDPYLPPREFKERFVSAEAEPDWTGFPVDSWRKSLFEGAEMPQADLKYAEALYDAELAYLDSQLEDLFDSLKEQGQYDDTLILVVGDHGEEFWEHGAMLHGGNLYDTQVSVPLLVKLPGERSFDGQEPSPHMQHLDFPSSIADMLGVDPPEGVQGVAWGRGRDYAMSENFVHWGRGSMYERELVAVEIGDYKYIRSSNGTEELFDLGTDPDELTNLIERYPELASRAREIAGARDQELARKIAEDGASPDEAENERVRERLRALGYID